MGGVAATAELMDLAPEVPRVQTPALKPDPLPSRGELVGDAFRGRGGRVPPGRLSERDPADIESRGTGRGARSRRDVPADQLAPRSSINRVVGQQRQLEVVRASLAEFTESAHTHGVKGERCAPWGRGRRPSGTR